MEPPFERYRKFWAKALNYNGIPSDAKKFSEMLIFSSVGMGVLFSTLYHQNPPFAVIAFAFVVIIEHVGAFAYLAIGTNKRAARVEEVLPDFLELMASNIRSGLTPDKALLISAREEFGALSDAVYKAGTKSITGIPLDEVMLGISDSIKSDVLGKTMRLVVEGLRSGGDLPELLSKTALDLRKFRSVRSEINSIILSYVLFITAAIALGAPLLYGISSFLVDIMVKIRSKVAINEATVAKMGGSSMLQGKLLLTSDGVVMFALVSIIITVFFGCVAIGSMTSGRRVEGLKYFPLIAAIAIGLFFGVRAGMGIVFGNLTKFA